MIFPTGTPRKIIKNAEEIKEVSPNIKQIIDTSLEKATKWDEVQLSLYGRLTEVINEAVKVRRLLCEFNIK